MYWQAGHRIFEKQDLYARPDNSAVQGGKRSVLVTEFMDKSDLQMLLSRPDLAPKFAWVSLASERQTQAPAFYHPPLRNL